MMSFAAVLAAMPDLLARALAEHVPDDRRRCRECRADDGTSAQWPCAMRLLADEARGMTGGPGPGAQPSDTTTQVPVQLPAHVPAPAQVNGHVPANGAARAAAPVTAPAPIVGEGLDTAPQPPVSESWDPLADRRAFRRDRFHH